MNSSISSSFFSEKSISEDLLVAVNEQDLMEKLQDEDIPSSFLSSETSSDSEYDPTLVNKANPADDDEIQGYDSNGRPIFVIKDQPGDKIRRMIELQKNSERLFTEIYDEKEGRYIKISKEDYQRFYNMINKGKTFSGLNPEEKPELKFIDQKFDFPAYDSVIPPKSVFTNKREYKLKAHIQKLIKQGKLDPDDLDGYKKLKKQYDERQDAFETLFSGEINTDKQQLFGVNKLPLPMTKDSYNPGDEYLKDEEIDKNISLRQIQPQTQQLAQEIYDHQNELYFKPRTFKPEETYENSLQFLQKQLNIQSRESLKPYPQNLVQTIRTETKLNCVDVSSNNKFIATGGEDCLLRIYEKSTGKLLQTIQLISIEQQKIMQAEHLSTEIRSVKFLNVPQTLLILCLIGNQLIFVNPLFNPVCYENGKNYLNLKIDSVKLLPNWQLVTVQGRVNIQQSAKKNSDSDDEEEDEINMQQFNQLQFQLNHNNLSDTGIIYTEINQYIQIRLYAPIPLSNIDISKNGKYILISSIKNTKQSLTCIKLHENQLTQLNLLGQKAFSIQQASWLNDTGSILITNQFIVQEYNLATQMLTPIHMQPNCGQVTSVGINNLGTNIVITGTSGKIAYFYGVSQRATDFNNFFKVSCQTIDYKDNLIVAGGFDGSLLVLKVQDNKLRVCTSMQGHKVINQQGIFGIKIIAGGFVSVGADGCLKIWQ